MSASVTSSLDFQKYAIACPKVWVIKVQICFFPESCRMQWGCRRFSTVRRRRRRHHAEVQGNVAAIPVRFPAG
jgi:hypothetical protein